MLYAFVLFVPVLRRAGWRVTIHVAGRLKPDYNINLTKLDYYLDLAVEVVRQQVIDVHSAFLHGRPPPLGG